MPASLSVVMPALDEALGISAALDDAIASLDRLVEDGSLDRYEVIVVDDGSSDGTGAVVAERSVSSPCIRLLTHPVNRGVGAALRSAREVATGDLLLYTDADMPVDLGAVRLALPLLERPGVGLVAGRRRSYQQDGPVRASLSHLFDVVARVGLGVHHRDVNFPFKLARTDVVRGLDLRCDGALADAELLGRVGQAGMRVESITLDYRERLLGSSKTMSVRLWRRLALELLSNGRSIRRGPPPG